MKLAVTVLVFCVGALLALGMVMLYSSSMAQVGMHYLVTQSVWCVLGVILCVVAMAVDYAVLRKLVWPIFILAVIMLALVYEPHLGVCRKGAKRWLGHGKLSLFQPSEFGKLALLITLAWYGEHYHRQMDTWKRGILIPALFIALILGLIYKEPDRGTTVLLAAVSGLVLLISGVRWRSILPLVAVAIGGLAFSLRHDPMRIRRIFAWVHQTKAGAGYQAYEAMVALGAGGLTGRGLGNGRQKLGFVPEQHTDFIFSVIGEELGLIATLLVVIAFVAIVVSGLCIALNSRDNFGLFLGCGISFLIGLQAFINIGVVTSALPNKGLPLPFISYGGSNLLVMLTCVGLLLSIARQAKAPDAILIGADPDLEDDRNPFRKTKAVRIQET
jgi:cell division protein FtsW